MKKETKNKVELDIVEFDEPSHTYTNKNKKQIYMSATTLIGKFKQPFDGKAVALEVTSNPNSKYYGLNPYALAAKWAKDGEKAAEEGTVFHKKQEDGDIERGHQILSNQQRKIIAYKALKKMSLANYEDVEDGIHLEMMIVSHEHLIAGLADKVVIDGKYFDIYDYKTTKQAKLEPIKQGSYYVCKSYFSKQKYGGYKKMKYPLNDINDCPLMHYTLQLSLYAYLLEILTGKKARNLIILHHPNQNGKIKEEGTEYPVQYLKEEIQLMLSLWGGFAPEDFKPKNQQPAT